MERRKPRVLVAVGPRAVPRVRGVLAGWCDVVQLREAAHLPRTLHGEFDLIVIGAHFDSSRGVDTLLQVMRRRPGCPVVCMRASPFETRLGPASFDAYCTACLELGAEDVLDLLDFPDDEAGNQRVRELLRRVMQPA